MAPELARLELRRACSGNRGIGDEDGERGCHRQRDHEPRRTGSHAGIVAPLAAGERRFFLLRA
jgi:hypothetical protein